MKSTFLKAFGWGAGCGLVLAIAIAGLIFYEQRPKAWNTQALRVKAAKAQSLSRLNEKFEEVSSGITFSVDVENATRSDLTLSSAVNVMGQTRASHALHGSFLKLPKDYFLPAGHVTSISLDSDDLCAANHPPQECFDSYFGEDEFIVVFDEARKYELLIPVPPLTLPRDVTRSRIETAAPACKNGAENCEPWERDWGKDKPIPGSVVTKQGTIVQPER